jgi:hypothetical protein
MIRETKRLHTMPTGILLALALGLGMTACSDNALAPFQPEITNVADNFQLQATGVTGRTVTLDYTWSNSGTVALVNHSTTTTAGSARVVIHDSAGALVYDAALVPSLNAPTLAGATGSWAIQLVLDHYSGTLNFRVQKST